MNQRPFGYEPNELPGCSTPRYLRYLYIIHQILFFVKNYRLVREIPLRGDGEVLFERFANLNSVEWIGKGVVGWLKTDFDAAEEVVSATGRVDKNLDAIERGEGGVTHGTTTSNGITTVGTILTDEFEREVGFWLTIRE